MGIESGEDFSIYAVTKPPIIKEDQSNHVRETVGFSRDVNNAMDRLRMYTVYHNYVKPYPCGTDGDSNWFDHDIMEAILHVPLLRESHGFERVGVVFLVQVLWNALEGDGPRVPGMRRLDFPGFYPHDRGHSVNLGKGKSNSGERESYMVCFYYSRYTRNERFRPEKS